MRDAGAAADLIEIVQSLALVGSSTCSTLSIDEVHLSETEEGEVHIAVVGMAARLAVAGHIGVLIDVDPLVEVVQLLDRVGRLEEQVTAVLRGEELGKGRCRSITTPLAIGADTVEELFLLEFTQHIIIVGGGDEEGGT